MGRDLDRNVKISVVPVAASGDFYLPELPQLLLDWCLELVNGFAGLAYLLRVLFPWFGFGTCFDCNPIIVTFGAILLRARHVVVFLFFYVHFSFLFISFFRPCLFFAFLFIFCFRLLFVFLIVLFFAFVFFLVCDFQFFHVDICSSFFGHFNIVT